PPQVPLPCPSPDLPIPLPGRGVLAGAFLLFVPAVLVVPSCFSPSSPGEGGWEGTGEEGRGDEGLGWGSCEAKVAPMGQRCPPAPAAPARRTPPRNPPALPRPSSAPP